MSDESRPPDRGHSLKILVRRGAEFSAEASGIPAIAAAVLIVILVVTVATV